MPGFSLGFSDSAAGATGGGNVFNAAPLFGWIVGSTAGSSTGNNPASATASPGPGATSIAPAGTSVSASGSSWLWILVLAGGLLAWKLWPKKKGS